MLDRRQFLGGSLLMAGAGAAWLAEPAAGKAPISQRGLDGAIPSAIGPYRAATATDVVLPPQDEIGRRIYDRYVARAYFAPDRPPIVALIAYGATQDYQLQLHRPESCYPASGWSLQHFRQLRIPLADGGVLPAVAVEARRAGRHEQILVWTRIGDRFPVDSWSERWLILQGALRRRLPDGAIVRLSTPMGSGDDALNKLVDFNRALLASTGAAGRSLLLVAAA
jgi:EpsI family protein